MAHTTTQTPIVPEWTTGDRLRRSRNHLGVTQEELAHILGIGLRAVKEAEAGKASLKRAVLLGWAVACHVDPEWLEAGTISNGDTRRQYARGPDQLRLWYEAA